MRYFELTDLADATIAQLEADGVTVSPQDVLNLQALSIKASGGKLPQGRVTEVGGVLFHPLTIGASDWFAEMLDYLRERGYGPEWETYCFAYASAHSRDRDRLAVSGDPALREVRRWRRGLRITEAELVDGVLATMAEAIGGRPPADGDAAKINGADFDRADVAYILTATVGGPLDTWLWLVDIQAAYRILAEALARQARAGGMVREDAGAERRGLRELADCVAAIRARQVKAEAGETARDGAEG